MSSIHSLTKEQPSPTVAPSAVPDAPSHSHDAASSGLGRYVRRLSHNLTTREGLLGDYDYAWLCMPALPGMKGRKRVLPPFYALDAELPILLAGSSGLQHALAMLAGLIAPPIIFASSLNLDSVTQSYMISSSLIGCGECAITVEHWCLAYNIVIGILSLVQMSRIRLYKGYYLGTGMLTVVGTSFATLSTASSVSTELQSFS